MEYIPRGNFSQMIKTVGALGEDVSRFYFKQLLEGLKYMQGKGVAHRDLKPENILLDRNWHIKISDFGFGTETGVHKTRCGTRSFFPPEMHKKAHYNAEDYDLFASAIIGYMMVTGVSPFLEATENDPSYYQIINNDHFEFRNISVDFKDLML